MYNTDLYILYITLAGAVLHLKLVSWEWDSFFTSPKSAVYIAI